MREEGGEGERWEEEGGGGRWIEERQLVPFILTGCTDEVDHGGRVPLLAL